MKKTKAIVSLLLVFAVVAGAAFPCIAEGDITSIFDTESAAVVEETAIGEETGEIIEEDVVTEPVVQMVTDDIQTLSDEEETVAGTQEEAAAEDSVRETAQEVQEDNGDTADTGSEEAEEEVGYGKNKGFSLKNSVFYDENGVDAKIPLTSTRIVLQTLRVMVFFLSGHFLYGTLRDFDATLSDDVLEICDYMKENSALDMASILTGLPDITDLGKLLGKVFQINVTEYRAEMYEMRDEYYEQGDVTKGGLCWLVGAYMSGIESAYCYVIPYREGTYQIALDVTYSDGTVETFEPGFIINYETGEITGRNKGGMMDIGFCTNYKDLFVYAPMYCWMRDFGFCVEYDLLCYILPMYRYRTRRFKFSYGDKDWMIQCWKGNYMCTNGGEVGIYNRDKGKFGSYYNTITDGEMMPMSLLVTHGDDVLVNVEETPHWWVNGFKLATRLYQPYSLTEVFTITFPDAEMRDAFCEAVDNNVYHDVAYSYRGLKVTCTWG